MVYKSNNNCNTKKTLNPRWLIWGVLCIAYMIVYFHRVSPTIVADSLMSEFGITAAKLGGLGAVYFYVYMAMQVPAGVLADTMGARKVVTAGCIMAGLGSITFSLASFYFIAYIGRFMVGVGVSVIFIAIMKIQSEWFSSKEFGTLSGLTMAMGNMGAVLGATPLALLVVLVGWRYSFGLIGVINIILGLICWLVVRNSPKELGLPRPETNFLDTSIKEEPKLQNNWSILESLAIVLKNKFSWPPFFIFFGVYGTLMTYSGMWAIPYLTQVYGLDNKLSSTYLTTLAFGIMLGSAFIGFISDKFENRKTIYSLFFGVYVIIWLMLTFWNGGAPPLTILYPLHFLMGFFGSSFVLTWSCAKEVNPSNITGIATGVANSGGFLGAAVMQTVFGYALDFKWGNQMSGHIRIYTLDGYQLAFICCLVMLLISIIGLIFLRETGCRNIYDQQRH